MEQNIENNNNGKDAVLKTVNNNEIFVADVQEKAMITFDHVVANY